MVQTIIIALLIVFLLQQCTPINITSASAFRSSKFDTYKYLKDGVESENYVMQQLSGHFSPSVTYQAEHNFFILESINSIKNKAVFCFTKLDSNGNELVTISSEEQMELPEFTHYVFSQTGIYDLSKKEVKEEPFKEIVNQDRLLEPKAWIKLFDEYYKAAQVVIFGGELSNKNNKGFPVYFRIEGQWIKLFTKENELRAYDDEDALKHNYKGYPAKFTRTFVLKDPRQKTFSNGESEGMIYEKNMYNYSFKYSHKSKIKSLHFNKELVYDNIAYTTIPILFGGIAYYRLKINGDVLYFKESAIKPLFLPLQNHFHWYILPDAYFKNSDVSFLELKYPSNLNESGSNGLYIIKRKTTP
jgi:hypothetical protein